MVYQFLAVRRMVVSLLVLAMCGQGAAVGVDDATTAFLAGEPIPLKVNTLTSIHTQLPHDYYNLPFCLWQGNSSGPERFAQNIGEYLQGRRLQSSSYDIQMKGDQQCVQMCQVTLSKVQAEELRWHIEHGYHNNWELDGLPAAAINTSGGRLIRKHFNGGFPIGFMFENVLNDPQAYVYNHVNIQIQYHRVKDADSGGFKYHVIQFAVEPLSVKHKFEVGDNGSMRAGHKVPSETCSGSISREDILENQVVKNGETILYTYNVRWIESDVPWSSRWNIYLTEDHSVPDEVHWYQITNAVVLAIVLGSFVLSILIRNLRQKKEEEIPWKLLRDDVFRPPRHQSMLLCVFLGSGAQLGIAGLLLLSLCVLGILGPLQSGSMVMGFVVLYALSGLVAGFVSAGLCSITDGKKAINENSGSIYIRMTAFLVPGCAFGVFLLLHVLFWSMDSTGCTPILIILELLGLWLFVNVPLVHLGAHLSFKTIESMELSLPAHSSTILANPAASTLSLPSQVGMLLCGVLPFYVSYVELFFTMTSLWMGQCYYTFGFALTIFAIMAVITAELAVLLVYRQLNAGNHEWWWFSFFAGGSCSFFTLLYAALFYPRIEASLATTFIVYWAYMTMIGFGMFLVFGTIGFLASFGFVCKIYATLDRDTSVNHV